MREHMVAYEGAYVLPTIDDCGQLLAMQSHGCTWLRLVKLLLQEHDAQPHDQG